MICSTCMQDKPLNAFHPDRRYTTGYSVICEACFVAALPTTLVCTRCGIEQPLACYARDKGHHTGRQQPCNTCRYEPQKAARLANPSSRIFHRRQSTWVCNRCDQEKPVQDFKTKTDSLIGHTQPCKLCCNQQTRQVRALHPEKAKARWQRYQQANREKERLRGLAKRTQDPEQYRAHRRAWRAANPVKARLEDHRRRTRKRAVPIQYTEADRQFMLQYWGYACAVCGRQQGLFRHKLSDDHWIPLNNTDCPGTIPTNMLPLCIGTDGCNNSKNDDDGRAWLLRRYGKRKATRILKAITTYFDLVRARTAWPRAVAD